MEKKLYAAYGSNMNVPHMAMRCPTAKVVGNGELRDFELSFKGQHANAHATVDSKKGGIVPVVVWELEPNDEAALDRYEGTPSYYRKENVKIHIDKKKIDAMIYIMNQGELNLPSKHYYNVIRDGYISAQIELEPLQEAVKRVHEKEQPTEEPDDTE
jgi:gamma-glutamylcyclotransferase (GGCT)/AIG2-like uncharacterized protein YtfP